MSVLAVLHYTTCTSEKSPSSANEIALWAIWFLSINLERFSKTVQSSHCKPRISIIHNFNSFLLKL